MVKLEGVSVSTIFLTKPEWGQLKPEGLKNPDGGIIPRQIEHCMSYCLQKIVDFDLKSKVVFDSSANRIVF